MPIMFVAYSFVAAVVVVASCTEWVRFVILINSLEVKCDSKKKKNTTACFIYATTSRYYMREKQVELNDFISFFCGASWCWWLLIALRKTRRRKKMKKKPRKENLLLLIENDVHMKITINQISLVVRRYF